MSMKRRVRGRSSVSAALSFAAALTGLAAAWSQPASAAVALVNFDPPGTPQGPSTYVAAGQQQTITSSPATFTGGVVLGFATFFPAITFATAPNVYGTADFGVGLGRTLNIAVDPGFATTEVSFALFNGETFGVSYTATAFDGATPVASQTLANIASNFNSGFGIVDLTAANITNVVIAPIGAPAVWDFLIDTVAFNQSVQQGVVSLPPPIVAPPPVFVPPPQVQVVDPSNSHKTVTVDLVYGDTNDGLNSLNSHRHADDIAPLVVQADLLTAVPEPATWALMLAGFGGAGALLRRRRARVAVAAG